MDDERYSLQELTEEAGVSARTVRYYIAEGLLPPPVQAGARSYYTRSQLDRLRLIGLLKDAFLPLKEIRRRLASLSDDALRQALDEAEQQRSVSQPASAPSRFIQSDSLVRPFYPLPSDEPVARRVEEDSALDYINRVLGERSERRTKIVPSIPPLPAPHRPAPDADQTWRRIALGDEAELVISDDLYQRRKERIESLVDWAKRMLTQD